MSRPSGSSPPSPSEGSGRADRRFWKRWGLASVVLGILAIYGAFVAGGPSSLDVEPDEEAPAVEADTQIEADQVEDTGTGTESAPGDANGTSGEGSEPTGSVDADPPP